MIIKIFFRQNIDVTFFKNDDEFKIAKKNKNFIYFICEIYFFYEIYEKNIIYIFNCDNENLLIYFIKKNFNSNYFIKIIFDFRIFFEIWIFFFILNDARLFRNFHVFFYQFIKKLILIKNFIFKITFA